MISISLVWVPFVICDSHRLVAVGIVCFFNTPGCTISFMNSPNFLLVIRKYHWKHPVALVANYRYDKSDNRGINSQRQNETMQRCCNFCCTIHITQYYRHTVPNELISPTDWSLSVFVIHVRFIGAPCIQILLAEFPV